MRIPFQHIIPNTYRPNRVALYHFARVGLLTFLVSVLCTGCAMIKERYGERCNFHAYTKTILEDYISSRYLPGSPVRMAIIPFSVPANLTGFNDDRPSFGNRLAWMLQSEMLSTGIVPIVEVMNREDWPSKKAEFFTGNFVAIDMARDAGYDLAMVGFLNPISDLERISAEVKIIDVESGVTVWYGSVTAITWQQDMQKSAAYVGLEARKPNLIYSKEIFTRLARCIAEEATSDRVIPE